MSPKQRNLVFAILMVMITGFSENSKAMVFTFDDLDFVSGVVEWGMPEYYAGFYWYNFGVVHKDLHPGSGFQNNTVSGDYTGFNSSGRVATLWGDSFTFNGAYFGSAWYDDNIVNLIGWVGDSKTYEVEFSVSTHNPVWFGADWSNLTRLQILTSHAHATFDNLTVNESASAPVPEPMTMTLFGAGLVALGGYRARRGRERSGKQV